MFTYEQNAVSFFIFFLLFLCTYPIFCTLVQISPILYGILHGLGCPHGIGLPAVQNQVAQERLVEGKGTHAIDTHAVVNEFDDGICVAAPYDWDLVGVVLELCRGKESDMLCSMRKAHLWILMCIDLKPLVNIV